LLTFLNVPAGALIGAAVGGMAVNKAADLLARRGSRNEVAKRIRALPNPVRILGQVLLGVLAGAQLNEATLAALFQSLVPVITAVLVMLALTMLLARYLFSRHGVDPLTAVMAAVPGGISELADMAQRQGAVMHVVLAVHLFRVLVVVLLVIPVLLIVLRQP
jgi:membrane AbrB-like protein